MRPTLRFLLPCLLSSCLLPSAPASAQEPVTIYRCTDAAGNLTVQNQPCPAGSTQRVQQMGGIASTPAAPASPATAPTPVGPGMPAAAFPPAAIQSMQTTAQGGFVTTSTGPEPRILDSANLPRDPPPQAAEADPGLPPPPPLFRCATWDNDSYLSEEQEVPPRCLPLRTVGLDGNPAAGAGRACEVVRDQCSRVADGAACDAWRRYAREAESRWRFAHPDNVERRRTEYERLAKIVGESCGG